MPRIGKTEKKDRKTITVFIGTPESNPELHCFFGKYDPGVWNRVTRDILQALIKAAGTDWDPQIEGYAPLFVAFKAELGEQKIQDPAPPTHEKRVVAAKFQVVSPAPDHNKVPDDILPIGSSYKKLK